MALLVNLCLGFQLYSVVLGYGFGREHLSWFSALKLGIGIGFGREHLSWFSALQSSIGWIR